ncbi:hypothetical protein AAY473_006647 [Plecturocebus cupreus]
MEQMRQPEDGGGRSDFPTCHQMHRSPRDTQSKEVDPLHSKMRKSSFSRFHGLPKVPQLIPEGTISLTQMSVPQLPGVPSRPAPQETKRGNPAFYAAGLKLLGSSNPPTSDSQVAGTTDMHHHIWLVFKIFFCRDAGLAMLPRMASNSWIQAILPPQPPKVHLTKDSLCHPGWSAVAQSRLTATSISWAQEILPPEPPKNKTSLAAHDKAEESSLPCLSGLAALSHQSRQKPLEAKSLLRPPQSRPLCTVHSVPPPLQSTQPAC